MFTIYYAFLSLMIETNFNVVWTSKKMYVIKHMAQYLCASIEIYEFSKTIYMHTFMHLFLKNP